jgi:hypothetical protein
MQGSKIQRSNTIFFFGMHLQECVAIAYFQVPGNRKHDKRCEFFHNYLHYGASYAHETGGV